MKQISIILLIITGFLLLGPDAHADELEKVIISIDPNSKNEVVPLNGKWEFYWKQLYTPDDFKRNKVDESPLLVEVPNVWTEYHLDGENLQRKGYATYRILLHFSIEEVGKLKALYMPSVPSAYTLWVDGEQKASNGKVGTSRETMEPENVPKTFPFLVRHQQVEIIIHASNYHQRKAGIYNSILLGEPKDITAYRDKKILYRSIIVTSLFIMGIYHIFMFIFRKKELPFIFFAIVCFFTATRSILLEENLASYLLDFLNWEVARKLEYMGVSVGLLFFSAFTYIHFKEDMSKKVLTIIITFMTLYSLFLCVTPAIIFTRTMLPFQIVIMITFLYLLVVYSKAFIYKRDGALLNAFALFMLFLTAVNDFLYFNFIVNTMELASFGLLFFIFTQSIILSRNYSRSFSRTEKLTSDLRKLNASLEEQVLERTMELQETNKKLQDVNKELHESHLWRSKWIGNISHEIATPLTSVQAYSRGMLDEVVPKEQKYIKVIYDQSLYLSRLLNDLHYMTDIETREIKMDKKEVSIRDYLKTLYDKYQLDLENNGVKYAYQDETSREEDIFVRLDPLKIEQVLVNLTRNARRFVRKDGGEIIFTLEKEGEDFVIIKVQDNGMGIKKEERELIFERFYRGSEQGEDYKGSGLGLAIAKEIIEYHNGQIGVESTFGEGSCFYFTLPIIKEGK